MFTRHDGIRFAAVAVLHGIGQRFGDRDFEKRLLSPRATLSARAVWTRNDAAGRTDSTRFGTVRLATYWTAPCRPSQTIVVAFRISHFELLMDPH